MPELFCRTCGRTTALDYYPRGCPACAERGALGLLEVAYGPEAALRQGLEAAFARPQQRSLWRFRALLPLPTPDARPVSLGEGGTPLLQAGWLGEATDLTVYLKNETANPTWCSKDRVNTVSVTVGKHLGVPGMVAITTGNHGTSMAAYAANAGLPAVALCGTCSDIIHRAMITAFGGTAIVADDPGPYLRHLVQERGWFPATSMTEPDGPNPYGVEGCKTVAYELYETLGGLPDAVFFPVASGDLLYGVYKGFRELRDLGFVARVPRMIGCQAEGAAPLAIAFREGRAEVPTVTHPATVAYSVGDATSGIVALEAVRASQGDVVTVSDDAILAAQRELAAHGLVIETASATTLAALRSARRSGVVQPGERVVCLLTGSGIKWSTQFLSTALGRVLLEPSLATLDGTI